MSGQFGKEKNDCHGQGDQPDHQVEIVPLQPRGIRSGRTFGKHGELGFEDHDCEPIDESEHNGLWDQANEASKLEASATDLNDSHENDRGKKVLHSHVRSEPESLSAFVPKEHERDHDYGQRPGCSGDHARTTAENCGDQANHEGRIKTDDGRHAGNDGKGHGLRDQGQGDGQAGQQVVFGLEPVAEFTID